MNACSQCGTVYDGAEVFCPKDGTRLGGSREERVSMPSVPPESDPLIDSVIQERYRVIDQIGEGGMGVVYIAEHVEIEKKVALKVLRDDFSKRPEVVERFRQEARAASKIGHAHIVDVTDFGQIKDGGVYFVMEYLKGQGLSDLIRGEPISVERAVPIVTQIARALQAAHKLGIVHRDLKPENIFLVEREEEKDFVKVLDFGIAKISDRDSDGKRLTKTGMIFGTPEYMSPEQAAGKELDHRVDIYALGCIMFEMFTGQVPFDGESFMAVLTQHMFEPIPLIESIRPETDIPPSVRNVVYRAMSKDKDNRYSDMSALEADLERALNDAGYVVDLPRRKGAVHLSQEDQGKSRGKARADTKGTAMDWSPPSGSYIQGKKKGWLGIGVTIAVAVLIVGGGLVYFIDVGGTGNGTPRVSVPVANEGLPVVLQAADKGIKEPKEQAPGESPSKESEKPQENAKAKKISVEVKSEPKEAVIFIEGLGQVCSKTPCNVELEAGHPVEIKAKLGNRSAKMTFTPSEQNKELVLEMKKAGRRSNKKPRNPEIKSDSKPDGDKGQSNTKTDSSGLKIPGIFKDD
ncbi:MAG: serine/threonine protein kinase [Proteobacteria bacterium]|nr:serine/threonine protein kinase [Pseudomonadota bacterium]